MNTRMLLRPDSKDKQLVGIFDSQTNRFVCEHRFSRPFARSWLDGHATSSGAATITAGGPCPFCLDDVKSVAVQRATTLVLNFAAAAAAPDEYALPKRVLGFRRSMALGARVSNRTYDPSVLLNQEGVYNALLSSNAVEPLLPEFYDVAFGKPDNCPLSPSDKTAPLRLQLEAGRGGSGVVAFVSVRDATLRTRITLPVVAKMLETDQQELKTVRWVNSEGKARYLTTPYLNEVLCSALAGGLVQHEFCPHFPLTYGFFACDEGAAPLSGTRARSGWILMEALDNNMALSPPNDIHGLRALARAGMRVDDDVLRSVAFQVVFAIAAMQQQFQMVHHDAWPDNVLVALTNLRPYVWRGTPLGQPRTLLRYEVHGTEFLMDDVGVLAKLGDFGMAAAYGHPRVLLKEVFETKDADFTTFDNESKEFRAGYDVAYFASMFATTTCDQAMDMAWDAGDADFMDRAGRILHLMRQLTVEIARQRGVTPERHAPQSGPMTLQELARDISDVQGVRNALNAGDGFKRSGMFTMPSQETARRMSAIEFLLHSDAFREYRERRPEPGKRVVRMSELS